MTALEWALLVVVLVIFVPVIFSVLRKWDYNRQVEGKYPIRKFDEDRPIPEKKPFNANAEAEQAIAKMKSCQNMFGPK